MIVPSLKSTSWFRYCLNKLNTTAFMWPRIPFRYLVLQRLTSSTKLVEYLLSNACVLRWWWRENNRIVVVVVVESNKKGEIIEVGVAGGVGGESRMCFLLESASFPLPSISQWTRTRAICFPQWTMKTSGNRTCKATLPLGDFTSQTS